MRASASAAAKHALEDALSEAVTAAARARAADPVRHVAEHLLMADSEATAPAEQTAGPAPDFSDAAVSHLERSIPAAVNAAFDAQPANPVRFVGEHLLSVSERAHLGRASNLLSHLLTAAAAAPCSLPVLPHDARLESGKRGLGLPLLRAIRAFYAARNALSKSMEQICKEDGLGARPCEWV